MSTGFEIDRMFDDAILGDYYLDYSEAFTEIPKGVAISLDSDGIPRVDYDRLFHGHPGVKERGSYGTHYTPVTIAEYALGAWTRLQVSLDPALREVFLRQADWLARALRTTDLGFGVWPHEFAFPIYLLEPPWVSAMAQGQGISVLLRAYQLTGDIQYLGAATSAFKAFAHGLDVGGVTCKEEGYLWFEEYPTSPPSHVLNGFIYALWGVLDYRRVTGSDKARDLWNLGIVTLRENISRYEMGHWTRYDLLSRHGVTLHYHKLHVRQVEVLAQLTSDPVFEECCIRWRAWLNGRARWRRLASRKIRGLLRHMGLMPRPAITGLTLLPFGRTGQD